MDFFWNVLGNPKEKTNVNPFTSVKPVYVPSSASSGFEPITKSLDQDKGFTIYPDLQMAESEQFENVQKWRELDKTVKSNHKCHKNVIYSWIKDTKRW